MSICPILQGDTRVYDLQLLDSAGDPVDLTSGDVLVSFILKLDESATASDGLPEYYSVIASTVEPNTGKVQVVLDSATTGILHRMKYYYQFKAQDTSVTPNIVETLDSGSVFVIGPS